MEILENVGQRSVAFAQPPATSRTVDASVCAASDNDAQRPAAVLSPARQARLGTSACACFALAFLGFAGGLFLAFFSFNNPDAPIKMGAVSPEMIYKRPAGGIPQDLLRNTENPASFSIADGSSLGGGDDASVRPNRSLMSDSDLAVQGIHSWSTNLPAWNGTDNWTTGNYAWNSGVATPTDAGSGAVGLPSVPEPSTWAMMLSGFGLLLVCLKRKRHES